MWLLSVIDMRDIFCALEQYCKVFELQLCAFYFEEIIKNVTLSDTKLSVKWLK